jgi:aspartyl-tRNA(Asn)/glutamyl-tRNA(Gln) amidotransferase subunit C
MTPPKVDPVLVRELAGLARLQLSLAQEERAALRLRRILEAFAMLRALPAPGVQQPAGSEPLPAPLRPDEPGSCLGHDQVLANAPAVAAGCFLVPRTVEE